MLSFLSERTCTERLKTNRFAKRGHTIQLRLGARLCRIHGRRMGNVLRMAFTQNRVRSCTGTRVVIRRRAPAQTKESARRDGDAAAWLLYGPYVSIVCARPYVSIM